MSDADDDLPQYILEYHVDLAAGAVTILLTPPTCCPVRENSANELIAVPLNAGYCTVALSAVGLPAVSAVPDARPVYRMNALFPIQLASGVDEDHDAANVPLPAV